jgi:hypothetical protein
VTTSIDGSRTVASLSPTELAMYCADLNASEANALTPAQAQLFSCQLIAIIDISFGGADAGPDASTNGPITCTSLFNACMNEPPVGGSTNPPCQTLDQAAPTCTATVSQVDQCIHETLVVEQAIEAQGVAVCTAASPQSDGGSTTPTCDTLAATTCPQVKQIPLH